MKNVNYKKIVLIILKILVVIIISSVVFKLLYDLGISIYQKNSNQIENNIYQDNNSNQIATSDKIKNNEEKWYINAYWKFAYAVFIIYAFYSYHKHKSKWWHRMY